MYIQTKDKCIYYCCRCGHSISTTYYYVHGGERNKKIQEEQILNIYNTYEQALPHIFQSKNLYEDYNFKEKDHLPHWNWDKIKEKLL